MKTPTIILFAIWIFTAYFYSKEVKTNKYLRNQLHLRDSVNKANTRVFEQYRKDSADYSVRFNNLRKGK